MMTRKDYDDVILSHLIALVLIAMAALAIFRTCGCASTVPLTPRIGIDIGIARMDVGVTGNVEWNGMSKTNEVTR
jgi:uncharacterized membrane protein (DUF441 family)